jgi:hypothetical protein
MSHTARLFGVEFAETAPPDGMIMRQEYSNQTMSQAYAGTGSGAMKTRTQSRYSAGL